MWKSSISFVMSVHLSTLNNTDPTGWNYMKFDISVFLANLLKKFSFIKICQKLWVSYMNTNIQFLSYFTQFFLEWEIFHTKVVEKKHTHTFYVQ
jgi:hypothetical protein